MTDPYNPQKHYDVFLSHNSTDKPAVEMLAVRLEDTAGIKAFLDKWHLVPGEPWQEALEEALENSGTCAVFLGPEGLGSWENEEMRSALDERVRNQSFRVIPVLLPGAAPQNPKTLPGFLRRTTWVDFRAGLDDTEAFRRLVAGIRGEAPGRGSRATLSVAPGQSLMSRWVKKLFKTFLPLSLLLMPSLLIGAAVWILMIWRLPTRVQVDASVDRAVFTVAGGDSTVVMEGMDSPRVTAEKFDRVELSPTSMVVADPNRYQIKEDQIPQTAWHPVRVSSKVIVTGKDESLEPAVTLESHPVQEDNLVRLDPIAARPDSEVSFEISGSQVVSLAIQVVRQACVASLSIREPFRLFTTYCQVAGISGMPFRTDSPIFRVQPSLASPQILVTSQRQTMSLIATVGSEKPIRLLSREGVPVATVDFTRQAGTGRPVSAVLAQGTIAYPDYPKVESISFSPPDFIALDQLERFRIETMVLDPKGHAIQVRLQGIAGHVSIGSPEFPRDCRLTRFEALWQNPRLVVIFSVLLWVLPTTMGAYKFTRELRGTNP